MALTAHPYAKEPKSAIKLLKTTANVALEAPPIPPPLLLPQPSPLCSNPSSSMIPVLLHSLGCQNYRATLIPNFHEQLQVKQHVYKDHSWVLTFQVGPEELAGTGTCQCLSIIPFGKHVKHAMYILCVFVHKNVVISFSLINLEQRVLCGEITIYNNL